MNILLVSYALGRTLGGIEAHAKILAKTLEGHGHQVAVACYGPGQESIGKELGVRTYGITIRNSGDMAAVARLVQMIRTERIDVVIANSGREYWPCSIAAKLCGRRILFIRHQTDRIRSTTRWLIEQHVEAVVAVSGAVRDVLLRDGVPAQKVVLIPNAVPLERFNPDRINADEVRKELGIEPTDMLIGTVVKLHTGKGILELLRAFAGLAIKYPALKLLYVGDGPDRGLIEQEIAAHNLSGRVILAGPRNDIERMYAAMDIFVLASTCDEAFGMVLIEAMAMRKPVIGTTVGGIPSIIEDGVSGLLVMPGSAEALALALSRYLEDAAFRDTIARQGERMVKYSFSDRLLGDRFEQLLNGKGREAR